MYYQTKEKAESSKLHLIEQGFKEELQIFEVTNARCWKFWLGTIKSWEHECMLAERRLKKRMAKKNKI